MEKRYDVIGIENLIMDFAVRINRLPKTDGFAYIRDYCWQSGGNASSAIVALARLGARCGMVGTTGSDAFGSFCREDMQRHGVDTSHIRQVPGSTTFCICLAEEETQGRSILGKPGDVGRLSDEEIDEGYIAKARAIHFGLPYTPASDAAIRFARKHNILVSLDAGGPVPNAEDLAAKADILIMSESFYGALFQNASYEENCASLLAKGPQVVIVTLGKNGCAGADANGTFRLESFAGCGFEIVDSTGAGDVFHGGFLYAWLHRYGRAPYHYTIKDCARFASAVSYINCMSLGGRTGIPDLAMVDTFLQKKTVDFNLLAERREFYKNAMFRQGAPAGPRTPDQASKTL